MQNQIRVLAELAIHQANGKDTKDWENWLQQQLHSLREATWTKWEGGECPVKGRVNVLLRNGSTGYNGKAKQFLWEHDGRDYDIIAYEVVRKKE